MAPVAVTFCLLLIKYIFYSNKRRNCFSWLISECFPLCYVNKENFFLLCVFNQDKKMEKVSFFVFSFFVSCSQRTFSVTAWRLPWEARKETAAQMGLDWFA